MPIKKVSFEIPDLYVSVENLNSKVNESRKELKDSIKKFIKESNGKKK
jgi:hypothetical protein